jgi:ABC transporter substrate binding protein (PQQ-dependent alcohol dehydrogenase system)
MSDNNTTGRFMNQQFEVMDAPLRAGDDPLAALKQFTSDGIFLIVTDAPADRLLALAAAGRDLGVVLFNIRAPDDDLRQADCRDNVIHVAPSRGMLTDAVGQYLVWKKDL